MRKEGYYWIRIDESDWIIALYYNNKWFTAAYAIFSENDILEIDETPIERPVDIKIVKVPNICFSLTKNNDEREIKFKLQRVKRGFDDSETWSLRDTIARFIIPRLERYEELADNFIERNPELKADIQVFLQAMKLVCRDNGSAVYTKEEEKIVEQGLNNFPKIFMSLWW